MASDCKDYDFIGSYDNQRISTINAERSVNVFEYLDPNGKRPKSMISTSGLVNSALDFTPETGGSRGTFVFNNAIYQVFGSSLFLITGTVGSLTKSFLDNLVTATGYVGIDANQYQVIFVDGVEGYIWDINATTFEQITDVGFPANPIDVCYLDGFFLVAAGGTNNFYLSSLNQGMVWSGGTANFTANPSTDILTLSTSNANFSTGIPITITPKNTISLSTTFSGNSSTNIITLSNNNANYPLATPVTLSTTGTLPSPLAVDTVYYTIPISNSSINPGTIQLATSAANANANIPIVITTNGTSVNTVDATPTFTANSGTNLITLTSITNANYTLGTPIQISTDGTTPPPLVAGVIYYVIPVSSTATDPGTIRLASSYANAVSNTPIVLTGNGTLTNKIILTNTFPVPLNSTTTYYVIQIGSSTTNPGTIKLATSYENAIAGIAIDITTSGASNNIITVSGQLQFGSITSHPGTIVACRTLHRRIFLFSQYYTEVWENAGLGTNLPFRRNNSLLMEVGTPAIGSVAVGFDRMFFLAQDRDGLAGVMEVKGTESLPVSNRALDYQLAQYAADSGVSDARGILIKENGLIFYRLNFTNANHTFVLNVSMSTSDSPKWHEEEVINGDRHPAQTHAYFSGVNFYGDYEKALFYIVSDQVTTNNGERIRRMRIGRQMSPEGYKRLRIDRWQLDLLQGALSTGVLGFTPDHGLDNILTLPYAPNAQPTVYLSVSKDGGQSYGNNLHATMGKTGDRTHRTVWRKIGTTPRGQGFVPRVEFFSEIPFIILGASWNFEILPE